MSDLSLDPIRIDVGEVLQRTVASLYAHLVTRPTGRAVRTAIEARLHRAGPRSLSLIDLSEVVILDFSCADEVVAKLLDGASRNHAHEAFFVLRGVSEPHRDPIEAVLERRELAVVAETSSGGFELLGARSDHEERVWSALERRGSLGPEEVEALLEAEVDRLALESVLAKRLAFRSPASGRLHALSKLARLHAR